MKIGFIGLGKLGLPCAEEMATAHTVCGYDIYERSSDTVEVLPTVEQVCANSEVIFIAAPTPHEQKYDGREPICHLDNKDFDYTTVKEILAELNEYCTKDHLVVLISTVLPGTTRNHFAPLTTNYRFIYNPYLIAMGSVRWDMVNPEMVIIGTEDGDVTGDAKILIEDVYKPIMQNDPAYHVGTWDEAESIKIFYNTFISTKVGLANMIQDVAIRNGNINVDVVTNALQGATMRITGPKYMRAGMGDAGPCHPRDNIALRYLAERLDLGYDLFDAIMSAREIQAENLAKYLVAQARETDMDVIIHGKAYKPEVEYIDGSYSLLVGHYVEQHYRAPVYVDPLTEDSVPASVKGVVLLAHNAQVTYGYTGNTYSRALYCELDAGSIVVDPWREFESDREDITVHHYGNTRIN